MNENEFMVTAELELAGLCETDWDRWLDEAERLAGHNLDGDEHEDGYSLDGMGEKFEAGLTPTCAIATSIEELR